MGFVVIILLEMISGGFVVVILLNIIRSEVCNGYSVGRGENKGKY